MRALKIPVNLAQCFHDRELLTIVYRETFINIVP